MAAVKFINTPSSNSIQRFNLLLESSGRSTHKTKPNEDSTLDLFYELIILKAFPSRRDPENYPKIRSVPGRIVLAANPLSPSTVTTLLALDVDEVFRHLSLARPLFIRKKYIHSPILPLRKPFPSFIANPNTCINKSSHLSFRSSPAALGGVFQSDAFKRWKGACASFQMVPQTGISAT